MDSGRSLQEAMALEALPLASRAQAARDRNFLARLRAAGKVFRRTGDQELRHPAETAAFISDIERRARAQGMGAQTKRGLDTIRPNAKKQKAKRRRR